MLAFIVALFPDGLANIAALDIGTGNGTLALDLQAHGCSRVTGSDYSKPSIQLASAVAEHRQATSIEWVLDDILSTKLQPGWGLLASQVSMLSCRPSKAHCICCFRWDLLTDKGTLDAIGLMANAKQARAVYKHAVIGLLKVGGVIVVTSCNASKDELVAELACEPPGAISPTHENIGALEYIDHVRTYPVLKYGGKEGTRVCTVAFRRHR